MDGPRVEKSELVRIAWVGLAIAFSWSQIWRPVPAFDLIGFLAAPLLGFPIFWKAITDVASRRMTMELSMTIALVAALAIKEVLTALVIIFFVLAAEVLESLTVGRGRRAIGDLLELLPRTAWIVKQGSPVEVSIAEVRVGDRVLIRPGARISVDGRVVSGSSTVEEAAITGEPLPQDKLLGSSVFAGTLNQAGALEVAVDRLGRDTTFGRIIEEVEKAEKTRAPIQLLADRLAGYLVYFALGSAALTLLLTHNWRSTISVVLVAGACGIAAGTPLAVLGAIGRAAQQGAVIKGGAYLEQLGKVTVVLLDKTGTLTLGKPSVTAIEPAPGVTESELLEIAAAAERNSEHPLGQAIVAAARKRDLPVAEPQAFDYQPGKGVHAMVEDRLILAGNTPFLMEWGVTLPALRAGGGTRVLIARDRRFLGAIVIGDQVREEAREAIAELRSLGLEIELLTGDTEESAQTVARAIGVKAISSGLLPQQKLAVVDQWIQAGATVAMIGDGINDAPALARAHVGVAMGSGAEIAHASANVLLIGNDLRKFVETVKTARWCRAVIYQNLYGTLVVDAAGIALAAAGLLNPLLAAFIHVTSELAFILNSTRLLPRKQADQKR